MGQRGVDDGKVCATCGKWQPLSAYNVRRRARDGRQSRCRGCCRAWYVANEAEHKANVRRRNDRVREELRQVLRDHLLSHPCVRCGEADLRVLELDHRDRADKADAVGRLVGTAMPLARVLAEIAKCDVLCANCHRIRTMTDCGSWRVEAEQQRRAREAAVLDDLFAEVMVDCPV